MSHDAVRHPNHYQYDGMECKDVLKALGLSKVYWHASALKYLMRAGRKGDLKKQIEDLEKAVQSISYLIEELEEDTTKEQT